MGDPRSARGWFRLPKGSWGHLLGIHAPAQVKSTAGVRQAE